jgi:signal transduction histidine kinase/DNA-binding NarL/FixJ family response regulator
MSGAATKSASDQMSGESIAGALLETEGYAAFEYLGDANFQPIGAPSGFIEELIDASFTSGTSGAPGTSPGTSLGAPGASLRLTERMPFLESFLPDAEECWKSEDAGRVDSGSWIERGEGGRQLALEASAFRLAGKKILLIRNLQKQFGEESQLLQKARESALGHERLLHEIQKKEVLLHCVIHDLSQPLAAMRGCFSLLAAESLSPRLRGLIEIGQRQSQNQEELIREILQAFSAELAAQETIHRDAATAPDLARRAQEVVKDFSAAFTSRNVRIEFDARVDLGRGWCVTGDESRLRRIYTNLVENALRYSPAGSTVTLGVIADRNYLRAYVDDEGPGLPAGESAARLFGLFAKGKDGGGKAGLGLYFCKMTVERWGGTIGCENRASRGTRFWFRLPGAQGQTCEPRVVADSGAVLAATDVKPLRLLLAEDAPVNRELTVLLLEKRGHKVVGVGNGKDALSSMEKQRFDAVILDEEMPGMGGLEVVRAVRRMERSAGAHIPMILVTGNDSEEARRRSSEAGVDAHVAKPFQELELFRTIEGLCGAVVAASAPSASAIEAASAPVFDPQELLNRVGGNPRAMRDIVRIFLEDAPRRMLAIRKALARRDAAALALAAHALRGSVAMLGAKDIAAMAGRIEALGRAGSIAEAGDIFKPFESKLSAFEKVLSGIAAARRKTATRGRKIRGGTARRGRR